MAVETPTDHLVRRYALLGAVPMVAGIAVALTFAFSSNGNDSASGGGGGTGVQIMNFAFHPQTRTVRPGAQVMVTNADGTTHTLSAVDGAFDTHDLNGGTTTMFVAPMRPGTYQYRCNIHQYMHGELIVAA